MTKLDYVAPELSEVGSFEVLTQGLGFGGNIDADFPRHTPVSALTFS
jgi:hypothetical protein